MCTITVGNRWFTFICIFLFTTATTAVGCGDNQKAEFEALCYLVREVNRWDLATSQEAEVRSGEDKPAAHFYGSTQAAPNVSRRTQQGLFLVAGLYPRSVITPWGEFELFTRAEASDFDCITLWKHFKCNMALQLSHYDNGRFLPAYAQLYELKEEDGVDKNNEVKIIKDIVLDHATVKGTSLLIHAGLGFDAVYNIQAINSCAELPKAVKRSCEILPAAERTSVEAVSSAIAVFRQDLRCNPECANPQWHADMEYVAPKAPVARVSAPSSVSVDRSRRRHTASPTGPFYGRPRLGDGFKRK